MTGQATPAQGAAAYNKYLIATVGRLEQCRSRTDVGLPTGTGLQCARASTSP